MYQLIFKPRAIDMAKDAYDWYQEKRLGLGDLFFAELERCYDKIEAWPTSYPKVKKDFRHIVLKTFPYVIVFKIIENQVVIYAVFHSSQNPSKKFKG
ncbi:MAG: type II toxin-antitoxin system RelE/ParE family toxin [Mucilaginibacter sp.]